MIKKIEEILKRKNIPEDVIEEFAKTVLHRKGYTIFEPNHLRDMRDRAYKKKKQEIIRKIENAIKILKEQKKNITAYSISKTAGINYRTAQKYMYLWEKYNNEI